MKVLFKSSIAVITALFLWMSSDSSKSTLDNKTQKTDQAAVVAAAVPEVNLSLDKEVKKADKITKKKKNNQRKKRLFKKEVASIPVVSDLVPSDPIIMASTDAETAPLFISTEIIVTEINLAPQPIETIALKLVETAYQEAEKEIENLQINTTSTIDIHAETSDIQAQETSVIVTAIDQNLVQSASSTIVEENTQVTDEKYDITPKYTTKSNVSLQVESPTSKSIKVKWNNSKGQTCLEKSFDVAAGISTIDQDITHLQPSTYYVSLMVKAITYSRKLVSSENDIK
jgi:hypothetical protein